MAEPGRILIIEDELSVRRFLRASLDPALYEFIEADSGQMGLSMLGTRNPDLVLLDLGLPDIDGVELARTIRERFVVPIIVLSARGREKDKIDALDAGADDYLTKPFGIGELLARIRVALRHSGRSEREGGVLALGNIVIDLEARRVTRGAVEVHLTPNEFKILAMLVRNADRVVTHRELLHDVWGPQYVGETQYLRIYMGQLRQKLEENPTTPRFLLNEPGVGYRLRTS